MPFIAEMRGQELVNPAADGRESAHGVDDADVPAGPCPDTRTGSSSATRAVDRGKLRKGALATSGQAPDALAQHLREALILASVLADTTTLGALGSCPGATLKEIQVLAVNACLSAPCCCHASGKKPVLSFGPSDSWNVANAVTGRRPRGGAGSGRQPDLGTGLADDVGGEAVREVAERHAGVGVGPCDLAAGAVVAEGAG